ncbi:MAG: cysteine synthase family protein [Ignavibacteriae bacterium]|nr:cysteine synthase family protein [Ignavibacteriota bacterium]
MYHKNILDLIGKTPLVKINNLTKGVKATVLAKIEFSNPGGSVKDRVGLAMVEDAEAKGLLKPGYTIVEATSGNTGIGLALAGRVKGYRVILVMTDKIGQEKRSYLKALGAEVVIVPKEATPDSPDYYRNKAKSLAQEIPNAINLNQYENEANPLSHYVGTGAEIWKDTEGKITHFVCGVGTAGTITGVSKYLKEKNPQIKVIGADPEGSNFKIYKNTGNLGDVKPHLIEGVGTDIIPPITDFQYVDEIVSVSDKDSITMCHRLAKEEGIFCGASSGTAATVALNIAQKLDENNLVVFIVCDTGERYLSKYHNESWLKENKII